MNIGKENERGDFVVRYGAVYDPRMTNTGTILNLADA